MIKRLAAGLVLVSLLSLSLGAVNISPLDWGQLSPQQSFILWEIRLPRLLGNILVGMALAVSGVALQALFRNPLAEAGLIGVSSSAALGAVLTIVIAPWFFIEVSSMALSFTAFSLAFLVSLLLYKISTERGYTNVAFMLLAGVAINALMAALTGLTITLSSDQQMRSVVFWMMGSFSAIDWPQVGLLSLLVGLGVFGLMRLAKQMDVYLLGETVSQQMGFDPKPFKWQILILTALMVGVSVSLVGIIGFVGLIVPHFMRLWLGVMHQKLLLSSALGGAILLGVADIAARTLVSPTELPIGLLMALLGAPFFLALLLQKRKGGWG